MAAFFRDRARSIVNVLTQYGRASLNPNLRLVDTTEREELINKVLQKIEYIDTSFLRGTPIQMLDVTQEAWEAPDKHHALHLRSCQGWPLLLRHEYSVWQDTLKSLRARAASLGISFRPRFFDPPAPAEERPDDARAEAASDSSCSPGQDYHKYETLYLSCDKAVKGVLQLHKAQT